MLAAFPICDWKVESESVITEGCNALKQKLEPQFCSYSVKGRLASSVHQCHISFMISKFTCSGTSAERVRSFSCCLQNVKKSATASVQDTV